jgi:plasmid stabilization system protein ParE
MKITFTAEALDDVKHAIDWYIDQGALPAALSVQAEVALTVRRAAAEPGIGTRGPRGTGCCLCIAFRCRWCMRSLAIC